MSQTTTSLLIENPVSLPNCIFPVNAGSYSAQTGFAIFPTSLVQREMNHYTDIADVFCYYSELISKTGFAQYNKPVIATVITSPEWATVVSSTRTSKVSGI